MQTLAKAASAYVAHQSVEHTTHHVRTELAAMPANVIPFDDAPIDAPISGGDDDNEYDPYVAYFERYSEKILFAKAAWTGLFAGLYGMTKKNSVPKPSDECFGDWIVGDVRSIR